jgi:hypothetical protein
MEYKKIWSDSIHPLRLAKAGGNDIIRRASNCRSLESVGFKQCSLDGKDITPKHMNLHWNQDGKILHTRDSR